jgi:TRAP-type mannitol/chloroaromatic compound transport system substrate-binding protein
MRKKRLFCRAARRLMGGLLGATLILAVVFTASTSFAVTWKLASAFGGGPFVEDSKQFAKNVEFLTEGRLKIQVFPGGTLCHPFKVTEAVQKGIAQIAHLWPGFDWGVDKTSVLLAGYPAGPTSEVMLHWIYTGGGFELWQQWRMARFGVVAFPGNMLTKEVFLHSKKPVRMHEDYKGLKIRTVGAWAPIAERLGATAVALPPQEIYTALERGVVDAAEWASPSVNEAAGLHKIAKYIIFPGIHCTAPVQEFVINKKAWDALSERDKKLFAEASKYMTVSTWLRLGDLDAKVYHRFLESGNIVINLDPSFIKLIEKVSYEWQDELAAKDEWFKRILESQRACIKLWEGAPRYR